LDDDGSIMAMKLTVSLPDTDVEFIDRYAKEHAVDSRSRVVQRALSLLRTTELGGEYAAASDEWGSSDESLWDVTVADGLRPAD
jgi:Arc/MetJ-type ribon-helix-helix transcriptional regulator